jgi:predicted nuclease of predicted toxin-antitoxin system
MYFLFDENMPIRLAKGLQILDVDNSYNKPPTHKIDHITEHKSGIEDESVVRIAKKLNAIIVSEDDDYKTITATYELVIKLRVGYVLFKPPKKSGCTYEEKVQAFVKAWPKLKEVLKSEKPPFMYIIDKNGDPIKQNNFKR